VSPLCFQDFMRLVSVCTNPTLPFLFLNILPQYTVKGVLTCLMWYSTEFNLIFKHSTATWAALSLMKSCNVIRCFNGLWALLMHRMDTFTCCISQCQMLVTFKHISPSSIEISKGLAIVYEIKQINI